MNWANMINPGEVLDQLESTVSFSDSQDWSVNRGVDGLKGVGFEKVGNNGFEASETLGTQRVLGLSKGGGRVLQGNFDRSVVSGHGGLGGVPHSG